MGESSASCPPPDKSFLANLIEKISSGQQDQERAGAKELRRLAKSSSVYRVCIAEVGAIPRLVGLLVSRDVETQTHAVTALLNLTLRNDRNKESILFSGGVDLIVEVLKRGCMEARENAAAALFSISSSNDSYKAFIGASEVFPGLVSLLRDGTQRGKRDAAAALYKLLQIRHNRVRAIRAGAVASLLQLVEDPSSGLVNESLTVIRDLASHQEGRFAIGNADGVRILVDLIRGGSDENKEYAAAVLLVLCQHDSTNSDTARKLGACELLRDLSQFGTGRAKRKANRILEFLQG